MEGNIVNNQQVVPSGKAPGYILWLMMGTAQILTVCCCCGCISCIFGILTIVFTVNANKAFKCSDLVLYSKNIKIAKIINIIGWVVSAVTAVILSRLILG